MSRSKVDPNQITQITFDEEMEAVRVQILPTEMEFDVHQMEVIEAVAEQEIATHNYLRMNIICDAPVEIKMVVAGQEVSLGAKSGICEICTPAIKVMADCIIVLQN